MSALLTKGQKAYLAQLAARAFAKEARGEDRDEWRHKEVAKACGKNGLRCCSQDDYGAVKAHFLNLVGEPGRALRADVRGRPVVNDRRQVEWKIVMECKRMDVPLGYAEGICRRMSRGKGLQEVDEGEAGTRLLWKVYFALKYEGKRRNHRGPEAQRGATKGHQKAQEEVAA